MKTPAVTSSQKLSFFVFFVFVFFWGEGLLPVFITEQSNHFKGGLDGRGGSVRIALLVKVASSKPGRSLSLIHI